MGKRTVRLLPHVQEALEQVGEQIKLARLRRKIPVAAVAERAAVSQTTVWAVERGKSSVSMGAYAAVLAAIGMKDDLLLIAKDDQMGRLMQDLALPTRRRAPKWKPEADT